MAEFSVKSHTCWCLGISVFLLLIFIHVCLVIFSGVFFPFSRAVISLFHFPSPPHYLFFDTKYIILITIITFGLYSPAVLVAFALLSTLFAAYGKDRATLWLSIACQGASILLLLTGVIVFLSLRQSYVSWEHIKVWLLNCVGVQLELIITTVLTRVLLKKLTSEWK